jgi:ABC-type multidrug transport system, ATPase component
MHNALEVRHLSKNYQDFALRDVNITLPAGCIMGFIGENGAGKSTTIKLILGLIRRDSGTVSVLGTEDVENSNDLKEHVGVVMDESSFPDNLTLRDVDGIMRLCYRTWDTKAFARFAMKFGLPEKKPVKEFSRGMKMKLSIAAALSHDSRLLILDEATSGLDPIVRSELLDVFLEFIQDEGHSILLSSHILSDLEKACDYITFIHGGQILFSEPKDELLEKYALVKCSEAEYLTMDQSAVIGARKSSFGVEALAFRDRISPQTAWDPASIEDIMLYFTKEAIQ